MNRPCFSLGVLLSSLAVCLLAVGSANSQTSLDLHTPCLMCPYAGSSYAGPAFAATADQADNLAAVAELPTPEPAEATLDNAASDDIDYDLDYEAEYGYDDEASYGYDYESDYDYEAEADYDADYDYEAEADYGYEAEAEAEADYGYDYEAEYGYDYEADAVETDEAETADDAYSAYEDEYTDGYTDSGYDYSEYDYSEYDYSDYDSDYDDDSSEEKEAANSEYSDSEYDYSDYDYDSEYIDGSDDAEADDAEYGDSEYDYSEYEDSEYEDSGDYSYDGSQYEGDYSDEYATENVDSATEDETTEYDESEYDYSDEYSYDEYEDDYSYDEYEGEYIDAHAGESVDSATEDASTDYDDSDYDYSEYDEADYDLYEAAPADADAVKTPSDVTPAADSQYDEFDNYDYEDYFAEVYGTDEAAVAEENATAEPSATDATVVADEDVDAFDYFDEDAFEPAADEAPSWEEAGRYDDYDASSNYELIEMIEQAQSQAAATPMSDEVEVEPAQAAELREEASNSDADIYDLRTTYDDTYDEVMAPSVETPVAETPDFSAADHCFGGYAEAYHSEYRCDLADAYQDEAYQSFYHDGTDPSAPASEPIDVEADSVADDSDLDDSAAFLPVVEPYVALVMDRVGSAWQQFSLDAVVAKAFDGMAKLPKVLILSQTSVGDYVECHIDGPDFTPHSCELDAYGPWEMSQPVGSGVQDSADSAATPAAETSDAALEAARASIRDLRTRMNAARQSPPLR